VSGRPLRVVQVITKLEVGGAQETVLATAEWFRDDPTVEVVTLAGPDDGSDGLLWDRARAGGLDVRVVTDLRWPIRPRQDVRAVRALVAAFADLDADVVHTHSGKAGLVGRVAAGRAGRPVLHTVHGWSTVVTARPPRRQVYTLLERALARRTERLVVVTERDRGLGLALGVGRPEQYVVVRSPIDEAAAVTARNGRGAWRERLGLGPDDVVVGVVGRLADPKDPLTVVDAVARLAPRMPGLRLVFVGDGPLSGAVAGAAACHGVADRVVLAGEQPRAAEAVGAFDVAVLSSRWEGLPRTVVEAAAAGVPVVANPVGGVEEVVTDGVTGLLYPVGDAEALAGALAALHDDPARAGRLAAAAAHRVDEDFAPRATGERLRALWAEAAGRVRRWTGAP